MFEFSKQSENFIIFMNLTNMTYMVLYMLPYRGHRVQATLI